MTERQGVTEDQGVAGGQSVAGGQAGDGRLWTEFGYQLGTRPDGAVELCTGCRQLGHCRLGLTEERLDADGVNRARVTCPADQQAGPGGVAHGGWVMSALDEILGHTVALHGFLAVTGTMTVRFRRPVPVARELLGWAKVTGRDGQKWMVAGELQLASSGAVLATAEGVWVQRDGAHYDRYRDWLAAQ